LLLSIFQGIDLMIMRRRQPSFQGRPAGEQSQGPAKARPDKAAQAAMKEDRARDAALAMQEYEAEKRAVLANTERLRALRLASQAGGEAPKKTKKTAKKDS
jgi:hypothetical protein